MARKKPRQWRKDFPYYKIQVFNQVWQSWTDEPRAYSSVEEARKLVLGRFARQQARIVEVDREGRRVLEPPGG
jgi:hypothetical protein